MSEQTPTLEQVLRLRQEGAVADLYIELPAKVERFDPQLQCVDATPMILRDRTLENGTIVSERLPTVVRAPVLYLGSGPFRMTFPIEVGSVVMLRFPSANLSQWLAKGGVSEAQDGRRHDLCSAVAYPGGHSFAGDGRPSTSAPNDAMVVHAPALKLGGPGAAGNVVVQSALDAFMTALNAAIPSAGTAAPALTALKTALQALNGGLGWRAGTSKTKAE